MRLQRGTGCPFYRVLASWAIVSSFSTTASRVSFIVLNRLSKVLKFSLAGVACRFLQGRGTLLANNGGHFRIEVSRSCSRCGVVGRVRLLSNLERFLADGPSPSAAAGGTWRFCTNIRTHLSRVHNRHWVSHRRTRRFGKISFIAQRIVRSVTQPAVQGVVRRRLAALDLAEKVWTLGRLLFSFRIRRGRRR